MVRKKEGDVMSESKNTVNQTGAEWQPAETAPLDGTAFYARYEAPFRWLPYKPTSGQFKSGIKGRWQMMNDWGGWDNTEHEPIEWRPHG
jgi:hypothetical protein